MGTLEELRESRDREATEGLESKMAKPARIRKEGGSSPMANFKDPIHHRRAWAC
mgnify:CR=1 FL=1